jgi:hypothetical protein
MSKMNSSSVKICESSYPLLAHFSPASRQKNLNCYLRRSNSALDRPSRVAHSLEQPLPVSLMYDTLGQKQWCHYEHTPCLLR